MKQRNGGPEWGEVLDFWFPEQRAGDMDAQTHHEHWFWRMRGGADDEIIARFSELTVRGAAGGLDHWASEPGSRLALIIVLDQFSRSLWRGTPRAHAQDPAALSLAMEGLGNGHYAALKEPWRRIVHICALFSPDADAGLRHAGNRPIAAGRSPERPQCCMDCFVPRDGP